MKQGHDKGITEKRPHPKQMKRRDIILKQIAGRQPFQKKIPEKTDRYTSQQIHPQSATEPINAQTQHSRQEQDQTPVHMSRQFNDEVNIQ
jgi:hypothetical protein